MFDFLRKKVVIEVPDGNGGVKKVRVTEKQFDEWERIGAIARVCKVHLHDIDDGEVELMWTIGKDISEEDYEKFKDENDELYMATHYDNGEKLGHLMTREMYDGLKEHLKAQGLE